jgi:hypothetical protein
MSEPAFDNLVARYGPEMGDFLTALGRTPRDWRIRNGEIERLNKGCARCPLLQVNDERLLKLPDKAFSEVAAAADNRYGHDPELRRVMMLKCGFAV